jgi:hypothetical protein
MLVGHFETKKDEECTTDCTDNTEKPVSYVLSSWLIEIHTISVSGDSAEWEAQIMESK